MPSNIHFGTDGWRAVIARDFTFDNVARCAQGLSDYLHVQGSASKGLVVGYDTRFLSRNFAETVAQVVAANGITVYLSCDPAPTPVLSFNVLHLQAAGAAIITASHNPGIWNGFKFKPEYAGSASQEITDDLESAINSAATPRSLSLQQARSQGLVADVDPAPPYLQRIESLVDLQAIRSAGLDVSVDAMFGAGGGYLPSILSGGVTTITEIRGRPNPAFPGMAQPEPIASNLISLISRIREHNSSVGLALDGDADRVGVVDENGRFITTLEVFSLLALYLLESKALRGPLVKGVTSSIMLNKLGEQFGVDVYELPVGFKNIGPKMSQVDALIAGEESGGFAFRGHVPERDGILSGLYILEYMARTGNSPSQLLDRLFDRVGPHAFHRRDLVFDHDDRSRLEQLLEDGGLTELAGMPVRRSDQVDGRRLIFDEAWLAARFSGTEPLLRVYAEAPSSEKVTALLEAAVSYLGLSDS